MCGTVLHYSLCMPLCCIVCHCVALYATVLHCMPLCCIVCHCVALYATVFALYATVCCIVCHCVALIVLLCSIAFFCWIVLPFGLVWCSVALCCIALHYVTLRCTTLHYVALRCIAFSCTLRWTYVTLWKQAVLSASGTGVQWGGPSVTITPSPCARTAVWVSPPYPSHSQCPLEGWGIWIVIHKQQHTILQCAGLKYDRYASFCLHLGN